MTVRAIYENDVFRPSEPVNLPEHASVEFGPKILDQVSGRAAQQRIYELMSESFESGEFDVAEMHNDRSENML